MQTHELGDTGFESDGRSLRDAAERRARFLGYFSLALGVTQLAFPGSLARIIGLRNTARTRSSLRLVGARELASGVGLLARPDTSTTSWARVAGDVMDLALLGTVGGRQIDSHARLLAAGGAVAGVAVLDSLSAAHLSRRESVQSLVLPLHVVRSITINRPPEEVYRFWRQLENLPTFMAHVESVRQAEDGSSLWRASGVAGIDVEWRAEITLDRPNECIAWRSLEGASIPNRGVVRFKPAPGARGTEVCVELKYDPPGGAMTAAISKLFGAEPGQRIAGDLRRLKQVLETGEVVHSDASIRRGLHAARPPAEREPVTLLGTEVRS